MQFHDPRRSYCIAAFCKSRRRYALESSLTKLWWPPAVAFYKRLLVFMHHSFVYYQINKFEHIWASVFLPGMFHVKSVVNIISSLTYKVSMICPFFFFQLWLYPFIPTRQSYRMTFSFPSKFSFFLPITLAADITLAPKITQPKICSSSSSHLWKPKSSISALMKTFLSPTSSLIPLKELITSPLWPNTTLRIKFSHSTTIFYFSKLAKLKGRVILSTPTQYLVLSRSLRINFLEIK